MNSCDGCTACCDALEVDDIILRKPAGVTCPHVCEVGCGIHESRPQGCRGFDCVYLLSDDDISMRPDKTGVIFERVTTKIYLALIKEERISDWNSELIRDYIKQLNNDGISVVVASYGQGLIDVMATEAHNPGKVAEITMRLASKWQQHRTQQI